MRNLVSRKFHKCLGRFDMLPVERGSEAGLFKRLSKHVFQSLKFRKYIAYESHLFLQNV